MLCPVFFPSPSGPGTVMALPGFQMHLFSYPFVSSLCSRPSPQRTLLSLFDGREELRKQIEHENQIILQSPTTINLSSTISVLLWLLLYVNDDSPLDFVQVSYDLLSCQCLCPLRKFLRRKKKHHHSSFPSTALRGLHHLNFPHL